MIFVENQDGEVRLEFKDMNWLKFGKGENIVVLDGTFSIDELREIIAEMEKYLK